MATKKRTATKKASTAKAEALKPLSQMQAAIQVLRRARKPMSCKEMVEAMQAKGLWSSPGGKTPEATLYASILRDLRKGDDARFAKAAPGRFSPAKKS